MKIADLKCIFTGLLVIVCSNLLAQNYQQAGMGNPLIPGYFADPTVKKFGDTFYIYATTDGNGGGFGPSQVWVSKDFVNWSLQDMNWPTTHHYWAPDVTQGYDGRYYLYYCQPVEIFGAGSNTPTGPWTSLLPKAEPIVPNFLVPNVITLDGQTFKDDDGKIYMYWGTWGIYPNHGCGVGLLNPDMKSFAKLAQIPNTVAKDFFEAPFMFKRKGIYYLTYSSGYCEDGTYRVQYATSKEGPMGPFVFGKNNPVLKTNADGTVHGPGHQSVLQQGDDFYLVYHRHNNPHSGGGYHRQVAADKIEFDEEGNIKALNPTHSGVGYLGKNANPHANLAVGKKVKASSFYSDDFKPAFALDDNNGTLWKPKNNIGKSSLEVDLGSIKLVKSVHTQFEYATWYYQYVIQYSLDGKVWKTYADRSKNTQHGSPMVDLGNVKTRYLKLQILATEYPGLNKAIWNIKVFDNDEYVPAKHTAIKKYIDLTVYQPKGLLVDLDAATLKNNQIVKSWANNGVLKGSFQTTDVGFPTTIISGKKALLFDGKFAMRSSFSAPLSLKGNSSFSVAMWVYNPTIEKEETILSWTRRGGTELTNANIGYGSDPKSGLVSHLGWADMGYKNIPVAGQWHHIALTFDGTMERLYVDGKQEREERKMLFIDGLSVLHLGSNADGTAKFSGALANLKLYDIPLTATEISKMAQSGNNTHAAVYFNAAPLNDGPVSKLKNDGYALGHVVGQLAEPVVSTIAKRMAISVQKDNLIFSDHNSLSLNWLSKPFSVVVQMYAGQGAETILGLGEKIGAVRIAGDAKWHHVVGVYNGTSFKLYLDGVSQTSVKKTESNKGKFYVQAAGGDVAISSAYIYDFAWPFGAVQEDYKEYRSFLPNGPSVAQFSEAPDAISPNMISMMAEPVKLPGGAITYQFTENSTGHKSGWLSEHAFNDFNVLQNKKYSYTVKARDHVGNVTDESVRADVRTDLENFVIHKDSSINGDANVENFKSDFWDGLLGKVDSLSLNNGLVKMQSTNTFWDGNKAMGPFLYKAVTGDFIAEVKIVDLSGLKEKKANGANDAGLMVNLNDSIPQLLQNSVMFGWGVGNLTTNLSLNGREQQNNGAGFNFYPHLQIQRTRNQFHLRGSNDGKDWVELPGSPIQRVDFNGKKVQLGIYQATYGQNSGYVWFSDFKITQQK